MKKPLFLGVATAIVTPFGKDGVDYTVFGSLIRRQLIGGVTTIVVASTTGEGYALDTEEKTKLIRYAKTIMAGRGLVLCGLMAHTPRMAAHLAKQYEEAGADGLLAMTPYCTGATREGVLAYYTTLTEATHLPVLVYHVPQRTGVTLGVDDYIALAKLPRIVGCKEADNNLYTLGRLPSIMPFYAGQDELILPMMAFGGVGVVSVLSNLFPCEMVHFVALCAKGHFKEAITLWNKLAPISEALRHATNPMPIKAAMAAVGLCENTLCPPLSPLRTPEGEWRACLGSRKGEPV